ncbi:MAG: transglycosylase SLT domain-containing protein [Desulfovibrio sp.]|jgi:membrane-bound lytic murein transglycosylase D|nr:transglycosylase SLT domain-containing protein [Desulfovibrio sp.]
MIRNRPIGRSLAIATMALCLMFSGGCGTHTGKRVGLVVHPGDTSGPLNATELAALKETKQVDAHVPASAMPDVEKEYRYFLRQGRGTMERFIKRSERYLAYMRQVFRNRGVPEEMAYLALVESGCRPDAKSPAGATGLWQFMSRTGKAYGLRQDWWMDERLDPFRSTEAAAEYFVKLHGMFKDWPTVAAAYNAGEGKISRAGNAAGKKRIFHIAERNGRLQGSDKLAQETVNYVPRFLAMTKIMRNLDKLGFSPIDPNGVDPLLRYTANPGTDMIALARACGIDQEELKGYNLHLRRPITPTESPAFIYIPGRSRDRATAFLRTAAASPFAGWKPAKIGPGDTWTKISRRSGAPESVLMAANPGKTRLALGDVVLVPGAANMAHASMAALERSSRDASPKAAKSGKPSTRDTLVASSSNGKSGKSKAPKPAPVAQAGLRHKLQADENLYRVALKYNVPPRVLQKYNGIDDVRKIKAGVVLRIPPKGSVSSLF